MKKFKVQHLDPMQTLIGKKLKDIFYQPVAGVVSDDNMFVVNFECEKSKCSLNVFCFFRIHQADRILLNSSDEYFDENYSKLGMDDYNKAEENKFKKTLLSKNIYSVKNLLKIAKIQSVSVSGIADIKIVFDNDVIIELLLDCLYDGYEYYRFIENDSNHHVICCSNGVIMYSS